MSIISLLESQTEMLTAKELESLITICKSDSQICGVKLRETHYKLGKMLAKRILDDLPEHDITLIIMMRAGLCFGLGIADELEIFGLKTSVLFYFNDEQWKEEKLNWSHELTNKIILTDAVINTGDNIIRIAQAVKNNKNIIYATNVISYKAIQKFEDKCLYTTRISEKSFIGSKVSTIKDGKGPDTGDRLFFTI
jgi:uracil phosphoribosyltransferase